MNAGTALIIIWCVFYLAVGGESKMTSCKLEIFNGSRFCGEYEYEDDFDIDSSGARITSSGIRGLITDDAGYSCNEAKAPCSVYRGWAAVVKYNNRCQYDCTIDDKVHWAARACYTLIILVKTDECDEIDINHTDWRITSIPIIYADYELGIQLQEYSVSTNDSDRAAEVVITATYFDYDLLWTLVGVGGIVLVLFCICCIAARDLRRYCRVRRWRLTRWSPRSLPQRKYKKGKELYETCVICQEDFSHAELVRVLPCKHKQKFTANAEFNGGSRKVDTPFRTKVFHANCVDEWLVKWNRSCPICKREILPERIRNLEQPADIESDSGTTASALIAVTDNASDTDTTENVPLLVTLHESSDNQTNRYGSVAGNNDEGFSDQYSLEPAMHTTQLLTSSSESGDGLSNSESYYSVTA